MGWLPGDSIFVKLPALGELGAVLRPRVAEIDALRGLAALGVAAVYHVHMLLGTRETSPLDGNQPFTWLHEYGWTLVNLFFVISGFIFAHVYLTDDLAFRPGVTLRQFAARRFARLYPLHLATLLIMAGLNFLSPDARNTAWHFLLNLLFLQESGLNWDKSFNIPAWSLSIEEACYLLFVCVALLRSIRIAAPILIFVGIVMATSANFHLIYLGSGLVGFFSGLMAWRLRGLHLPTLLLLSFGCVGLVVPEFLGGKGILLSLTLWPALVLLAPRFKALGRLRWLGDRSYSIYLLHVPVYTFGRLLLGGSAEPQWQLPVMLGSWAAILVLSDLSFRHLEQPARRWLRVKLEGPQLLGNSAVIGANAPV